MKTGELLLTIMVIAMSTVPVIMLVRAGNARNRFLIKALLAVAKKKKLNFKYDIWSNKLLAIDNDVLYYLTSEEDKTILQQHTVNLDDVIKYHLNTEYSSDKKKSLKRMDIIFHTGGVRSEVKVLNLYNQAEDDLLETGYYIQLGKKWNKTIAEYQSKLQAV